MEKGAICEMNLKTGKYVFVKAAAGIATITYDKYKEIKERGDRYRFLEAGKKVLEEVSLLCERNAVERTTVSALFRPGCSLIKKGSSVKIEKAKMSDRLFLLFLAETFVEIGEEFSLFSSEENPLKDLEDTKYSEKGWDYKTFVGRFGLASTAQKMSALRESSIKLRIADVSLGGHEMGLFPFAEASGEEEGIFSGFMSSVMSRVSVSKDAAVDLVSLDTWTGESVLAYLSTKGLCGCLYEYHVESFLGVRANKDFAWFLEETARKSRKNLFFGGKTCCLKGKNALMENIDTLRVTDEAVYFLGSMETKKSRVNTLEIMFRTKKKSSAYALKKEERMLFSSLSITNLRLKEYAIELTNNADLYVIGLRRVSLVLDGKRNVDDIEIKRKQKRKQKYVAGTELELVGYAVFLLKKIERLRMGFKKLKFTVDHPEQLADILVRFREETRVISVCDVVFEDYAFLLIGAIGGWKRYPSSLKAVVRNKESLGYIQENVVWGKGWANWMESLLELKFVGFPESFSEQAAEMQHGALPAITVENTAPEKISSPKGRGIRVVTRF
ncbi:MAG: uncharacterized protein A8A55_1888 [Amphiamblys sp. WSBS2006]|nr:MAG: uncharacterized protein A8A55_1888 [Amphiamblys sp. WSBS2006]